MREHDDGGLSLKLRPRRRAQRGSSPSARRLAGLRARLRRLGRPRPSRRPFVLASLTAPSRLQRSTVKVSYVAARSRGQWRAHGRYLAREGAQREGERGTGFDRVREDGIGLAARLSTWQEAGDARLWKLIVSPENAAGLDLREHTRRLMEALEDELGTKLEWVAIDHQNTGHPHVHVALRGVHERGHALRIPRDVIQRGKLRAWSQALATQVLGLRTEHELRREREHAVQAARYTGLDATLEARADASRRVAFEGPIPRSAAAREQRLLLLRRLAFLRDRGLARRVGSFGFELAAELRPALLEMALRRDVQRSMARDGIVLGDPGAELRLTRIEPGTRLLGRFVGVTRAEEESPGHWILEGVEGRVHVVPESAALDHWRSSERLEPGDLVSLRGVCLPAAEGGGGQTLTQAIRHGRLEEIETAPLGVTVLDLEAVRSVRSGELSRPSPDASVRGFAARWRAAVEQRRAMLERAGMLGAGPLRTRPEAAQGRSLDELERDVEARMKQRLRAALTFEEIERLVPRKPIERAREGLGMTHRGTLVAYAYDEAGGRYAILDTGRTLTAIPTADRGLEPGRRVLARARMVDVRERELRRVAWQLEDARERDRGRGR